MKTKALILSTLLYPFRFRNAKRFNDWQYYRENLWPTPCQHKRTKIISASLKTLVVQKQCHYCKEVITIDCTRPAA